MKKHLSTLALLAVFIIGLMVLLYPTISDAVNARNQSRAISQYDASLNELSDTDFSALLEAARQYNANLAVKANRFYMTPAERQAYYALLSPTGHGGVIGIVEIPAIEVRLPLYHGTEDAVLQVGIGHIEGTSLPVGGTGTHAAVSGHRGLPSALLLTNLDRVEVGDLFTFSVLGEVMTYEIDQIAVVEPEDVSLLAIDPLMDYATLVTCTPYGVNSHRLLVRGHRVDSGQPQPPATALRIPADARLIDPIYVAPALAAPMLLGLLIYLLVKYRKPPGGRRIK